MKDLQDGDWGYTQEDIENMETSGRVEVGSPNWEAVYLNGVRIGQIDYYEDGKENTHLSTNKDEFIKRLEDNAIYCGCGEIHDHVDEKYLESRGAHQDHYHKITEDLEDCRCSESEVICINCTNCECHMYYAPIRSTENVFCTSDCYNQFALENKDLICGFGMLPVNKRKKRR